MVFSYANVNDLLFIRIVLGPTRYIKPTIKYYQYKNKSSRRQQRFHFLILSHKHHKAKAKTERRFSLTNFYVSYGVCCYLFLLPYLFIYYYQLLLKKKLIYYIPCFSVLGSISLISIFKMVILVGDRGICKYLYIYTNRFPSPWKIDNSDSF